MTSSDTTLALPAKVLRIGVWPSLDMGRGFRHWLPSLLASLCINLIALYLFAVLLRPAIDPPEFLPIQVTLSQAPATKAEVKPTVAPPPKPKPPRVEPRPKPVVPPPPKPEPQPEPVLESEPQPVVTMPEPPPPEPEPMPEPEPPPPPKAQPLFKLTRLPAFVEKNVPAYPESERAEGREAEVLAEVFLDASGRVLDVTILKSAGTAFDQAVINALNESRFTPGYIASKAVAVRFQIPFHFQLD